MITVLHGKDDFSRDEALQAIRASIDGDGLADNTARVDGRSVQPDELLAGVQTVPFLASKRLIIVNGLLGKFQAATPRRGRTPRKTPANLGPWQVFVDGLSSMPDTTLLVLLEGELAASNPIEGRAPWSASHDPTFRSSRRRRTRLRSPRG